jgi:signal transduction histidine kinase
VSQQASSNHLLDLLGIDARRALSPVSVQLQAREVLYEPGTPALYAYFPVNAVVALVSLMENGATTEVALIGREGMVGLASVFGTVESPTAAVVQIAGTALKVPAALLKNQRLRVPSIRAILDLYTEAHLIQVSQTAACNRLHSVEARLARWLLAIADRIAADEFRLPHELMAQMLGVHRPTVSTTLQRLQDIGVIAYRGRSIVIADRVALERMACECYGVLRREFERLLRPPLRATEALPRVIEGTPPGDVHEAAALEAMREIAGRLLLSGIREQEARDAAEAANQAKDQFLAMVSHELRTPLNCILGWCAILAEQRDQATEHGLTVIYRNAQALFKLVEELLDASRLTSNTLSVQPSPVDFPPVVRSVVETVQPAAAAKGVMLRLSVADELAPLFADADRLRQVLLNVITNALKFTDAGGSIDVMVTTHGPRARVCVRDTGRGITPDVLPHVFERFRQGVDSTAGHQGLGLGLSIAKMLVELHGGTIQVASPGAGQGTSCTIELPMTTGDHVDRSVQRTVGTDVGSASGTTVIDGPGREAVEPPRSVR